MDDNGHDAAESTLELARETLTGDLRDALLYWLKKLEKPWIGLTEDEQESVISMLQREARRGAEKAVNIIAADGRHVIEAELGKVVISEGITATITCKKSIASVLGLGMAEGSTIQIVSADSRPYVGQRAEAKPDPQQPELPLAEEGNGPLLEETTSNEAPAT